MVEHIVIWDGANGQTWSWSVVRFQTPNIAVARAQNQVEAIRIRDALNLFMNQTV